MDDSQIEYLKKHIDKILRPKVRQVICAYSDLLGFGACLDNLDWDIEHEERHHKTIKRLSIFVKRAREIGGIKYTCFALNDCLAINYDLPEEEPVLLPPLWGFLLFMGRTHARLNYLDQNMGFPGVRTVWAAGKRLVDPAWIQGLSTEPRGQDISHPKGIICITDNPDGPSGLKKKLERIATYTPREFQLNIAFSKAYALDEEGSAIGLRGPYLFVDESLLRILCYSFKGDSRTSKDCWGYEVIDVVEGDKRTITLRHEDGQASHDVYSQLTLRRIRARQKMRWGDTSTYRLMEIRGPSFLYNPEIIQL